MSQRPKIARTSRARGAKSFTTARPAVGLHQQHVRAVPVAPAQCDERALCEVRPCEPRHLARGRQDASTGRRASSRNASPTPSSMPGSLFSRKRAELQRRLHSSARAACGRHGARAGNEGPDLRRGRPRRRRRSAAPDGRTRSGPCRAGSRGRRGAPKQASTSTRALPPATTAKPTPSSSVPAYSGWRRWAYGPLTVRRSFFTRCPAPQTRSAHPGGDQGAARPRDRSPCGSAMAKATAATA